MSILTRHHHSERGRGRALGAVLPALVLFLLFFLAAGGSGCTKRVALSASETNIADGRTFEIELSDDRKVHGKLTPGSIVRLEQGDSLFSAEVDEVSEEFIEFSRRELVADHADWDRLQKAGENSAAGLERPEVGGALLARDEIESVSLVTIDRRRVVVETIFWAALVLAVGYAGLSH